MYNGLGHITPTQPEAQQLPTGVMPFHPNGHMAHHTTSTVTVHICMYLFQWIQDTTTPDGHDAHCPPLGSHANGCNTHRNYVTVPLPIQMGAMLSTAPIGNTPEQGSTALWCDAPCMPSHPSGLGCNMPICAPSKWIVDIPPHPYHTNRCTAHCPPFCPVGMMPHPNRCNPTVSLPILASVMPGVALHSPS